MKQQEMFIPPSQMVAVICGAEKRVQLKRGVKIKRCQRVVYLHPAVDPRYLNGECGLCGQSKVMKSPGVK